jgi:hypothetical protein
MKIPMGRGGGQKAYAYRRTDNTMAKRNRKKDKQLPTKLYTENSNFSDVNSLKI